MDTNEVRQTEAKSHRETRRVGMLHEQMKGAGEGEGVAVAEAERSAHMQG